MTFIGDSDDKAQIVIILKTQLTFDEISHLVNDNRMSKYIWLT